MPLTTNKKIDRKALSLSDDARPDLQTSFIAPRNDLEQSLAYWFTDVLRVQRVGIADNFFDLGGDSLMATRIVSRLHEAFRADVTIPQLFRAATVSALAELVRAALPEGRADKIGSALCRIHSMSDAEKQEVLSRQGR
jgi:acyl carrier protein